MAETIFVDWPRDHPAYKRIRRQQALKVRLLFLRGSVVERILNSRIREAIQRLEWAEFLVGTQWRPEQSARFRLQGDGVHPDEPMALDIHKLRMVPASGAWVLSDALDHWADDGGPCR